MKFNLNNFLLFIINNKLVQDVKYYNGEVLLKFNRELSQQDVDANRKLDRIVIDNNFEFIIEDGYFTCPHPELSDFIYLLLWNNVSSGLKVFVRHNDATYDIASTSWSNIKHNLKTMLGTPYTQELRLELGEHTKPVSASIYFNRQRELHI